MKNSEFYEKYGPEEGQRRIDKKNKARREWWQRNKGYSQEWIEQNRQKWNEYARRYQSKHREEQQKRVNDYHEKPEGRAVNLLTSYVQFDRDRKGWLDTQLTRFDIMAKCFSDNSKCVWCGETDWKVLGLDRVTNSKPHDVHNTVCSCRKCNIKRQGKTMQEYLDKLGLTFDQWLEQNGGSYSDGMVISYSK